MVELLEQNPDAVMSTLGTPIRCKTQLEDPACVKVALTISSVPCTSVVVSYPMHAIDERLLEAEPAHFHQHIGLYAYRRDFLLSLTQLPQSEVEI